MGRANRGNAAEGEGYSFIDYCRVACAVARGKSAAPFGMSYLYQYKGNIAKTDNIKTHSETQIGDILFLFTSQ